MKTLIEVGAYDGFDSIEKFHKYGYQVFTFEPKKDLYDALVERSKNLSNYTVIEKAVCLHDGKTLFNICKSGGASSILPFRSNQ
jgi:FkbM family methyltransferase